MLSLQDYRRYRQNRTSITENDLSLLRSKIRELHPVQRASLGALLRHLCRVASHLGMNGMSANALAIQFSHAILRGDATWENVKALLLEDLIQNAHILFDECLSSSPLALSSDIAETTTALTHGSFSSLEFPQPAEVRTMGSTTQSRPPLVGSFPTSSQSSFSSLLPDTTMESHLATSPSPFLSPLIGLPSSKTLTEGVETTTQEQVTPEIGGTEAIETLANPSTPLQVASVLPTAVAEWRLRQSRLPPQAEAVETPQSPPVSVLSSSSDFPLSSATSLQTRMGLFPS
ncbi:hypothetical protein EI94DRAFT_316051 [Lactarius quietus]|nr:hypothetical protein EI94DRAFT_316051 [Lactarius quietus]